MKHLVQRITSTTVKNHLYSCAGFGDIVHTCTLVYEYALAHNEPVTLHITERHNSRNKPAIWKSIMGLLPQEKMFLKVHEDKFSTDSEFIQHVNKEYPDAVLHYYKSYPGKFQKLQAPFVYIDDNYLANWNTIHANPSVIKLPEKFVTAQFDSQSKKRSMDTEQKHSIIKRWRDKGYEVIVIGGEGKQEFQTNDNNIAYALSKADYHIGVDSGMMHFARLFKEPGQIYMYAKGPETKWSHHLKFFKKCGVKINED